MELPANAARFSGFADLYDSARPSPPAALAELLCAYAGGRRPALVVDLGCGTGLSTRWCRRWADRVVGVEPSADMRARAVAASPIDGVTFVDGWSHRTGLPDGCASVVVAVQALHWMEPEATFAEVARLLAPGGVFAAIDCEWPPAVGHAGIEQAWEACMDAARRFEPRLAADTAEPGADPTDPTVLGSGVQGWPKPGHLARMRASGRFRWCRELAVHAEEPGDADRLVRLLRSFGGLQDLLRRGFDEDRLGLRTFADAAWAALGDGVRPFWFTYRVRLGVT